MSAELIEYFQLGSNLVAITIAGIIYLAYINNLRSSLQLANSQIDLVRAQVSVSEQNLQFFKDRVADLEKRTPDKVTKILSDRINILEDEIGRLASDRDGHKELVESKNSELQALNDELEKVRSFGKTVTEIYDEPNDDSFTIDLIDYGFGVIISKTDKYLSVQQLLDELYVLFLHEEHPPYSYLETWKIIDSYTGDTLKSAGRNDSRDLAEAGVMSGVQYRVVKI